MISGLWARLRSLWYGVRRTTDVNAEIDEEFRHHMQLRTADLTRAGLSPAEAARRATLEFGSTERYKEQGRDSRGLRFFDALRFSWLDFKLGFRMLARYPGLTVVGGLAIAFSVCVGAGTFEFVNQVLRPTLPLDGGDRIVGILLRDRETGRAERRALNDFITWREQITSVLDLGAFHTVQRNLLVGGSYGEPVEVAEMSASGFRVARVPPLLGRTLDVADEQPGAPPVAVLGYDVWQARLGGDSAVVGHTLRLGSAVTTVVGIMPKGFAFPVAQNLWVPLHLDPAGYEPLRGPSIQVFGRLAPSATIGQAQAELTALGLRATALAPDTHNHLSPRVVPFARSIVDVSGGETWVWLSIDAIAVLLLVLACTNVALLMFARAAGRETEFAVRTALGARRARIVTQLLAEALVLGGVAAVVGIVAARAGLNWWLGALDMLSGSMPFWYRDTLSPRTLVYAAALALLGAVIAGVTPGLKVTRCLQNRLKQAKQGGGRIQFGGVWTLVIVAQVAVTITVPAFAFFVRRDMVKIESTDAGFPEHEYLSARLQLDREAEWSQAEFQERFNATVGELEELITIDQAVAGVTLADRLPHFYHPHSLIEVEEGAAPLNSTWPGGNCTGACAGYRVSTASVDQHFCDVLDAPILAGRGFGPADFAGDARSVIVNQSFVQRLMGGRNPIGRRLRYTDAAGRPNASVGFVAGRDDPSAAAAPRPWYEIVGVVRDMAMATEPDPKVAGIYHPLPPTGAHPLRIAVHVPGDAKAFAQQLRSVAARADPTLRLDEVVPLDEVREPDLKFYRFWFWMIVILSAVVMSLSMAGIYSIMAFTVSRRTREIGIRVALGSNRLNITLALFRRPLTQVALGGAAGLGLTGLLSYAILRAGLGPSGAAMVLGYAMLMMGACLLACVVPTRRALSIEPTEALREE
jgi:putative ABC transport system permease protein